MNSVNNKVKQKREQQKMHRRDFICLLKTEI